MSCGPEPLLSLPLPYESDPEHSSRFTAYQARRNSMNVNYFNVRLAHKSNCFIRTESIFFEIAGCRIQTDAGLNDCDALVVNAV